MKQILLTLFCLSVLFHFGQSGIAWSGFSSGTGSVDQIMQLSDSSFYLVRYKPTMSIKQDTIYTINRYKDFKLVHSTEVNTKIKEENARIEAILLINKRVHVFLSDIIDNERILYLQKYSEECKPLEIKEISKYLIPNKLTRKGNYRVLLSENKEFVATYCVIPGSKKENDKLVFTVFSKNMEAISSGEHYLGYTAGSTKLFNNYLSNKGELFLLAKLFKSAKGITIKQEDLPVEKIILYRAEKEHLASTELPLKFEKYITSTYFSENPHFLLISALYGDKSDGSTTGMLHFKYDRVTRDISGGNSYELKSELFSSLWNTLLSKNEPVLHHYRIMGNHIQKDGSVLVMLEQVYRKVERMGDGSNSIHYFYNDILLFNLDKNNEIRWTGKIDKHQKSQNEGGHFSSFLYYEKNNKILFLFNDNAGNYDMEGKFFQCQAATDFATNSNVCAQVEVDLSSGELQRKICFKKKETGAITVPRLCYHNPAGRQLVLFLELDSKEKYGLLDY